MAYLFARSRERVATLHDQHSEGLRAQRIILFQRHSLEIITEYLKKFREIPSRETRMPTLVHPFSTESIDYDSLAFLLSSKQANIVQELYLAEWVYMNPLEAVKTRSRLNDEMLLVGPRVLVHFQ